MGDALSCRNSNSSTLSGSRDACLAFTIVPAMLNNVSDGTDVETIPKYLQAIDDNFNKIGLSRILEDSP